MNPAYYNEFEPFAAEWLRNLIRAGHISPGDVDTRSIKDVQATDLIGYSQCHFFAGIGVWSRALRGAGWPDSCQVWTGSCPCQPFSAAGSRKGFADDRHLWPDFFRLISECRPDVVFGEQVASPDGLGWFDAVSADLEGAGYAVGALDTCAASVGAPHIRQRLYWMAIANQERRDGEHALLCGQGPQQAVSEASGCGVAGWLADATTRGLGIDGCSSWGSGHAPQCDPACGLGNASGARARRHTGTAPGSQAQVDISRSSHGGVGDVSLSSGAVDFWANAEWIPCTDGKARPIEPGTFPLAYGATSRVGRLRAYGNALVETQAQEFVTVAMECMP